MSGGHPSDRRPSRAREEEEARGEREEWYIVQRQRSPDPSPFVRLSSIQSPALTSSLRYIVKSNVATDLPPEQRISDDDILHNINTFMFAGSDTTSLAVSWTLYLLAQNPTIQTRLRAELLSIAPTSTASLTADEIQSLYDTISNLPLLHNVSRESLRLIPPVHSSLRVATQDDDVPTSYPVHLRDGTILPAGAPIKIGKGSFVHVPVEAFNLDKEVWGDDAWGFKLVS